MKLPLIVPLICALLASGTHAEQPARLPLWHVAGDSNDVYLLASVHLLRTGDYPLPDAIYRALDDAETVVMELDMDDLDHDDAARLLAELALTREGASLATMLGDETFRRAEMLAAAVDLSLEPLARSEPWYATITLEQLLLARLGFSAQLGIENHLMERALAANKEIRGLETLREQLEILDQLPLTVQRTLFMKTLEDGPHLEDVMNELIDAWHRGDMRTMARTALQDVREEPRLYADLVVRRNRNWAEQIAELLQRTDDYLIVVGALHLVGDDAVPALLEQRGYAVRQLEPSTSF